MEKENPKNLNLCVELELGSKEKTNDVQEKIPHVSDEDERKNLKRKLSETEFESKDIVVTEKLMIPEDCNNSINNLFSSEAEKSDNEEIRTRKLKYKCFFENCNQKFFRERDLDRHEFQHNGVAKYSCDFSNCVKKYRLRAHLNRHKKVHEKKKNNELQFKCDIENCNRQFVNQYNLNRHKNEFHEKIRKFACIECDRVYERKIHLDLHLIEHSKEYPLKCFQCNKGFVNEMYFKRHHCPKPNICYICEKDFKKWSELVMHRNTEHQLYNCSECGEMFESKQKLTLHKKKHRVYCVWEGCTSSYADRRNLRSHVKTKHLGHKHMCTVDGCNKEFISKSTLKKHLRTHEKPPTIVKKCNKTKNRKKRKDAGIPRKSIVDLLANMVTKRKSEQILKDEGGTLEIDNDRKNLISVQI